jgi:hypothetical protein
MLSYIEIAVLAWLGIIIFTIVMSNYNTKWNRNNNQHCQATVQGVGCLHPCCCQLTTPLSQPVNTKSKGTQFITVTLNKKHKDTVG